MQGNITMFRQDLGLGIIVADSGHKFRFTSSEIRNPTVGNHNERLVGLEVDFIVESRKPRDIILLQGSPWAVFAQASRAAERR